ncbi:MAG: hypothetical protein JWR42_2223 [Marmoricola sp.]|nr:hypothetical protein [Marmoricola sp.]
MSYERLAYDDQDTASDMHADCTACARSLPAPRGRVDLDAALRPAPPLAWDLQPRESAKPRIEVSRAAAHLASRLHLHLD